MSTLRARPGGPDHLRTGPWRGDPHTAHVAPIGAVPSATAVRRCLDALAGDGYRSVLTAALGPAEQAPFLDAGFDEHERLQLLAHDLDHLPASPGHRHRRARRGDWPEVLTVDAAAFPPFWRLDEAALADAVAATPVARFRLTAGSDHVTGYAVTGRAGPRGYLQRLAVDPDHQRQGLGATLVVDGLRWARRWRAREVLVNTQETNEVAITAYERLGFRPRRHGLAVLRRELTRP